MQKAKPKAKPRPFPEVLGDTNREGKSAEMMRRITVATHDEGQTVSHLIAKVFEKFGGIEAFAQKIKTAWDSSKDGSVTQQRIVDMMMRLLQADQKEKEERRRAASDQTTEELEATLRLFVEQNGYATLEETEALRAENKRLSDHIDGLDRYIFTLHPPKGEFCVQPYPTIPIPPDNAKDGHANHQHE